MGFYQRSTHTKKSLKLVRLPLLTKKDFNVDESGISQGDVHHYISSPLLPRIGSFFSNLFLINLTSLPICLCPAQPIYVPSQ